jgi:hypothetical protein
METKAVNLLPLIQIVHACIIPSYFIVTRSNQYIFFQNRIMKISTGELEAHTLAERDAMLKTEI